MLWLVVALLSGAVAGVGFWRGTPQGLATESMPALAGVLFALLMYRATTAITDRTKLGALGGWPLRAAGALSLTAALAGAIDVGVWLRTKTSAFGPVALPVCVVAFVLLMITALRLSLDSPRKTQFQALALVAAVNALASAWLFIATQGLGTTGP